MEQPKLNKKTLLSLAHDVGASIADGVEDLPKDHPLAIKCESLTKADRERIAWFIRGVKFGRDHYIDLEMETANAIRFANETPGMLECDLPTTEPFLSFVMSSDDERRPGFSIANSNQVSDIFFGFHKTKEQTQNEILDRWIADNPYKAPTWQHEAAEKDNWATAMRVIAFVFCLLGALAIVAWAVSGFWGHL